MPQCVAPYLIDLDPIIWLLTPSGFVMAAPTLDIAFVRSQFPAFSEPSLQGQAFFENAGGSFACLPVIERLSEYYRRLKVQPYYAYAASAEAGEWMDSAYRRMAEYLGVGPDEIHFGPSTSQNTYVLAQALRKQLRPGDEIIVTNQDHEANIGVWRRLAVDGVQLREWRVNADSGTLSVADLDALLTPRTRLLAFTHCSNIVAHINPVADITARAREVGAISIVDGVSFAPHGFPDVAALGADIYLFSLYKTFGPHQGLMVIRPELLEGLGNEAHEFNGGHARKRLVPAGPDHAQIAASAGIADYFDALDAHHGGGDVAHRPQRVRRLFHAAEQLLVSRLLDYLLAHPGIRLLGPAQVEQRAGTLAFVPLRRIPSEVATRLAAMGIMAASGNFYAVRLLEAMGIDPAVGVLRLSLAHYTTDKEVNQLITALDAAL